VRHRLAAAVDDAPEDDVEHPAEVLDRHLGRLADDRHRGLVDPGVEAAELGDRGLGDAGDGLLAGHVGGDGSLARAVAVADRRVTGLSPQVDLPSVWPSRATSRPSGCITADTPTVMITIRSQLRTVL
jgi:hypothetical protein